MSKKHRKIAYISVACIALAVFSIAYWVYFSSGSDSSCCQVVDSTEVSPSGEWTAQAIEQSWGLSGGHYMVTLASHTKSTET
ncbi:MAG: hypothetical protein ACREHG_00075, partial [Candidatus Saccharimonadales bacterium]